MKAFDDLGWLTKKQTIYSFCLFLLIVDLVLSDNKCKEIFVTGPITI